VEYLQGKTEILGEKPAHKSNLGLCIDNLATAYSVPLYKKFWKISIR